METKIIFNINYLKFAEKGIGTIKTPFFNLTNDNDLREEYFTDLYKSQVGLLGTRYGEDSVFGYYNHNWEDEKMLEVSGAMPNLLNKHLDFAMMFVSFLWLIKDNSVGISEGIAQTEDIGLHRIKGKNGPTNCIGNRASVEFSKEDFIEMGSLMEKIQKIKPEAQPVTLDEKVDVFETDKTGIPYKAMLKNQGRNFNYNNTNCIERALTFLLTARATYNLIYKIGYYMPIFECLFTTDSHEITTKLAYRTAFYISDDKEERKDIFKTISEAYNIRSKFLHGQVFDSKANITEENLTKISTKIDGLLRRVLKKIITTDLDNFKAQKHDRDKFLNQLIFG